MNEQDIKQKIWTIVGSIPKGKVASYGQVATIAGYPSHARYVGSTLKKLPADTRLPWHRVVNAQGKIAFSPDTEAYKRQRELLAKEGITLLKGRVSMTKYRWEI